MDTLRHNIGRLFTDGDSKYISVIVDVVCEDGKYKYVYYMLQRGEMLKAFASWFEDDYFVKWLTPPRQNPVAQPPQRQNGDASE